jgi:hypothetical protein
MSDKENDKIVNFVEALKRVDSRKQAKDLKEELSGNKYVVVANTVLILEASTAQAAFERAYDDLIPARLANEENWNLDTVEMRVFDFDTGRWLSAENWREQTNV